MPDLGYGWHVHHQKLYEKLTEPIEKRIKYIESSKNQSEVPLRLKLLRPVKDQAQIKRAEASKPRADVAWAAFEAALKEQTDKLRYKGRDSQQYKDAEAAAEKALSELKALQPLPDTIIAALHKQECEPDCPWDPVQQTIFPSRH